VLKLEQYSCGMASRVLDVDVDVEVDVDMDVEIGLLEGLQVVEMGLFLV